MNYLQENAIKEIVNVINLIQNLLVIVVRDMIYMKL
jgi:hypothetical protein